MTFPQFRGHPVKPPPSSLRTRQGIVAGKHKEGQESLFWRDRVAERWGLPEVPPHGLSPTAAFADFMLEIHGV
jgi:hypothetical protein